MTVKPIWREHNYDSQRAPYYCLLTREVTQRTKGQSPYLRYLCLCLSAALPVRQPTAGLLASRTPVGATRCTSGVGFPRTSSRDRKSTRLNSSHGYISYAVFCLKNKKSHRA